MAKNMKIRRGNDGFSYPYTSPDLVVDENGKSATTKFNELEGKIEAGSGTSIDDVNTSTDKTWSSSKIDSQFKDIAKQIEGESMELAGYGKKVIAEAITNKGVTTNNTDTFEQMATNIEQIQTSSTGIIPTGIIDITENGNVDVTNYASANVNVQTTTNIVGQNSLNKCGSKKFKFAIFSDVHTTTDDTKNANIKFKEAIAKVQELGCEFITITGDLCNYDVENELNQYKSLVDANATIPIYEVAGNHDATQNGLNTTLWKTITGQDPYYEIIHKNEVFLFLSQYKWSDNNASGMLPQEYRDWVNSKLEQYKTKNRVFFFFHQYMPDCEGFGYRNGTQNQSYLVGTLPFFTNLINTYKNVIWFSGHSHTKFEVQTNYPNVNAYNKNGEICTMIHVPTLQEGEYYVATVYDHLIELEGYKNGTVVDTVYFAIDDYIYTSPVQSITLDKSTLNFANTDIQTITATVTPSSQQELLTWETSDVDVATVINGVVTPVGNGNCIITAKCGDKSVTCNVNVDISESELYYSITTTLNGCTLNNTATKIKSEETYVATIATKPANCTINTVTVKMGGVDISTTAYNSNSETIGINVVTGNIEIIITVNKLVTGLSVSPTSVSFKSTGETKQLTVVKTPSDAIGDITWETSNADVAVVTNGLVTVTATSSGSCIITAKCNGHSTQCNVTVEILQKEVVYSVDSKTFTISRAGAQASIGDTNTVVFTTPLKANTRYYMRAQSLKYADGTDVNIPTEKIYIVGAPWVVGADKQCCSKINIDYSDFVGHDVTLVNGFGTEESNKTDYSHDITKYGDIEKFSTFQIKASSSSPVTFPVTVTLTGFEIFTYGETFTV